MTEKRLVHREAGFSIISAFWNGKFQCRVSYEKKLCGSFTGESLGDAHSQGMAFAKEEAKKHLPLIKYYRNAVLSVIFDGGNFVGRVQSGDQLLFKTEGFSKQEEALTKIKGVVDDNPGAVHTAFLNTHRSFLASQGLGMQGEITKSHKSAEKRHRQSHCWACRHPVDNLHQYECSACGWIICTCGACGCAYKLG